MRFLLMMIFMSLVTLGMRSAPISAALPGSSPSPSPTPTIPLTRHQLAAQEEANAAAKAYREGRFSEAEQHALKAIELDPTNTKWRMYFARTVHAQYRPRNDTPENVVMGYNAIEAYRKILEFNPTDEETYKAVAYLYSELKDEEKFREWVMAHANDSRVEASKRAEAYVALASKDWDCSFKITELPLSKIVRVTDGKVTIRYRKPQDPKDFTIAQRCVSRGLEDIEHAITLDPNSESAWSYKTNLLLESSKLFEMEGKLDQKAELVKQSEVARQRTLLLTPRPSPQPR